MPPSTLFGLRKGEAYFSKRVKFILIVFQTIRCYKLDKEEQVW